MFQDFLKLSVKMKTNFPSARVFASELKRYLVKSLCLDGLVFIKIPPRLLKVVAIQLHDL